MRGMAHFNLAGCRIWLSIRVFPAICGYLLLADGAAGKQCYAPITRAGCHLSGSLPGSALPGGEHPAAV